MRHPASLIAFLVLVVGGGLAVGYLTPPGEWYASLSKPEFVPPGWIFGPVWTALYVLIAVAGWRVWQRERGGRAMVLWWTQLALNFAWSPVVFGAHHLGGGLAVIVLLLTSVLGFVAATRRSDSVAAWLFVPYAAWVSFALVLNASLVMRNGGLPNEATSANSAETGSGALREGVRAREVRHP